MVSQTLLAASAITLAVALAYLYVAARLGKRRDVEPGARTAMRAFGVWWGALGLNLLLVAPLYFAMGMGWGSLALQETSSIVQRALLAVSLVGLMAYMMYVLTGRAFLRTLIGIYAGYFVLTVAIILSRQPTGFEVLAWRSDLTYANPDPLWSQLLGLALIVLPPVISSVAYLRLFFRTKDRSQRYRIVVVSSCILIWWVLAVAAGQKPRLDDQPFQLMVRALSLATALLVLAAFLPPLWVRRRFRVDAYAS